MGLHLKRLLSSTWASALFLLTSRFHCSTSRLYFPQVLGLRSSLAEFQLFASPLLYFFRFTIFLFRRLILCPSSMNSTGDFGQEAKGDTKTTEDDDPLSRWLWKTAFQKVG